MSYDEDLYRACRNRAERRAAHFQSDVVESAAAVMAEDVKAVMLDLGAARCWNIAMAEQKADVAVWTDPGEHP